MPLNAAEHSSKNLLDRVRKRILDIQGEIRAGLPKLNNDASLEVKNIHLEQFHKLDELLNMLVDIWKADLFPDYKGPESMRRKTLDFMLVIIEYFFQESIRFQSMLDEIIFLELKELMELFDNLWEEYHKKEMNDEDLGHMRQEIDKHLTNLEWLRALLVLHELQILHELRRVMCQELSKKIHGIFTDMLVPGNTPKNFTVVLPNNVTFVIDNHAMIEFIRDSICGKIARGDFKAAEFDRCIYNSVRDYFVQNVGSYSELSTTNQAIVLEDRAKWFAEKIRSNSNANGQINELQHVEDNINHIQKQGTNFLKNKLTPEPSNINNTIGHDTTIQTLHGPKLFQQPSSSQHNALVSVNGSNNKAIITATNHHVVPQVKLTQVSRAIEGDDDDSPCGNKPSP